MQSLAVVPAFREETVEDDLREGDQPGAGPLRFAHVVEDADEIGGAIRSGRPQRVKVRLDRWKLPPRRMNVPLVTTK
jgi:hypothetical protein